MKRIRILICDDHPVFRTGVRTTLDAQPDLEIVAEAADGEEAVALARRHRPDVVLMDLRMPKMDGVAATAAIKKEHADTVILVLTTYDSDSDILRAVEVGAAGFVLKDAPAEDLMNAIRNVGEGRSPLSPAVAARLMERLRGGEEEVLSGREVEILRLVAQGTSNREIASELWISEATVESHLNRLMKKLDVPDRTAAVTAALKRGIIRLDY